MPPKKPTRQPLQSDEAGEDETSPKVRQKKDQSVRAHPIAISSLRSSCIFANLCDLQDKDGEEREAKPVTCQLRLRNEGRRKVGPAAPARAL